MSALRRCPVQRRAGLHPEQAAVPAEAPPPVVSEADIERTVAALIEYLPHRIKPAPGVHNLITVQGGRSIATDYPNLIVRQMAATHSLLAQRTPPVTADTVAHTGFWDTPPAPTG